MESGNFFVNILRRLESITKDIQEARSWRPDLHATGASFEALTNIEATVAELTDMVLNNPFAMMPKPVVPPAPRPISERLWPEEMVCGCNHGECTVCWSGAMAKEFRELKGNVEYCHTPPLDCCATCNLITREKLRWAGQAVPAPTH